MPNWAWWQYLFLGYLIGCASVGLCAWLFGRKGKAPDDAATSEPEQRKLIDISILREAEKVKRKNKEEN